MIRKLLIANRGEIAVRVMRTARAMGIRTVAVYSEADRESMHTRLADESVFIGEPEPTGSYLDAAKILDAARQTGADAIHPGYGFLSERAKFSEACAEAGITFVGPPASAMRRLGAKIDAKNLAVSENVPITPGYFQPGATDAQIQAAAEQIGYPVMLKASAGGGGRGMRVVREPARVLEEIKIARDEALRGFGNDAMMVEKLIERPRHIEIQVIADAHGNVACLFERECSLQRRHQKLVEEAPAARPIEHLWPTMRDAARRLVRASGYVGAGTVEFIVDAEGQAFYFLEVNARLQVEHPVTEAITGLDLVRLQLEVASGMPLAISKDLLAGERSAIQGHAIEVRIVAEDPARGFLPSVGRILAWAEPRHPGVRVDTGFGPGAEVSRFYDSLLAKVVAHGTDRAEAIARLRAALEDFHVLGVKTNVAYLLDLLEHPEVIAGRLDTGFLGREFGEWQPGPVPKELANLLDAARGDRVETAKPVATGAWALADKFRV